jgi:hypothetical protein
LTEFHGGVLPAASANRSFTDKFSTPIPDQLRTRRPIQTIFMQRRLHRLTGWDLELGACVCNKSRCECRIRCTKCQTAYLDWDKVY